MKKKAKPGVKPMDATLEELCALRYDHRSYGGRWCLMTDTTVVWLSEQKCGEVRRQFIEIPRAAFNTLLDWYVNEQPFVRRVREKGGK